MEHTSNKTLDHYTILKTLGFGVSCKVKLAQDTQNDNKKVAIKILKPDLTDNMKEMVFKEVENMKDLDHPNILR